MEGRPRRGRRRRQTTDQASPPSPGTAPVTESQPVAPAEEAFSAPTPEASESTPAPQVQEDMTPSAPSSPSADELPFPQTPVPTSAPPPQTPAPAQTTTAPSPPQAPHPRSEPHPQHPKPEPPKGQKEHGRGDHGREARSERDRSDRDRGDARGDRGDQGRRVSQEGIVATMSIPIRVDNEMRRIDDLLRSLRKSLEEECMVGQDDASERVLLDLAVNAIRDRITIHRIQPITRDLDETEILLRLRQQTDRHVVEMLAALKTA